MDEVFGYVPPSAQPPAKKPILTIFKQGRAFGLGLVLSTQNPVDLDYKAMSNAGTWLVGRLQTENDKARVLEGLRSAAGGTDVAALDKAIGGLGKRQFLLVSAKASEPRIFGDALGDVVPPRPAHEGAGCFARTSRSRASTGPAAPARRRQPRHRRPRLRARRRRDDRWRRSSQPGTPVSFLDPAATWAAEVGAVQGSPKLRAFLAARVSLRYDDSAADVDEQQEFEAVYGPLDGGLDLASETQVDYDERDFGADAPPNAAYVLPQAPLGEARFFSATAKEIQRHLVDRRPLELQRNRALKLVSRPGESPEEFAARCDAAAQEKADAEAAKIRDRLEAKRDRLEKALEQAERRVEELEADTRSRQDDGAHRGCGRHPRRTVRRPPQHALDHERDRRRGLAPRDDRADAGAQGSAEEKAEAYEDDLAELEQEILDEVAEIDERWRATAERSTRSRSGSRRPTCACSRRASCGCRATDLAPPSCSSWRSRRAAAPRARRRRRSRRPASPRRSNG